MRGHHDRHMNCGCYHSARQVPLHSPSPPHLRRLVVRVGFYCDIIRSLTRALCNGPFHLLYTFLLRAIGGPGLLSEGINFHLFLLYECSYLRHLSSVPTTRSQVVTEHSLQTMGRQRGAPTKFAANLSLMIAGLL